MAMATGALLVSLALGLPWFAPKPFEQFPVAPTTAVEINTAYDVVRLYPGSARCDYCPEFDHVRNGIRGTDDSVLGRAVAAAEPERIADELAAAAVARLPEAIFGDVVAGSDPTPGGARLELQPMYVFSFSLDALHVAMQAKLWVPGRKKPRYESVFWFITRLPGARTDGPREAREQAWAALGPTELARMLREGQEGCLDLLAYSLEGNGRKRKASDKRPIPFSLGILSARGPTVRVVDGRDWVELGPLGPIYAIPSNWKTRIGR